MTETRLTSAVALKPASDWALFLDVDGTILHLRDTPDAVEASAHLLNLLETILASLGGATALVSGRSIANLDELFAPHRLPTAGLHGLQRRDAGGKVYESPAPAGLDALRPALLELASTSPKIIFEDKGHSLAVHYRQAPEREDEINSTVEQLIQPYLGELHLMHGKMVCELKPRHANKGTAIRDFMNESPFAGRVPVFVGDDVTDEDGFIWINGAGGHSIRVIDDRDDDSRNAETAARFMLAGVNQVMEWLETWPAALKRQQK